jgi:hypothetical protein
MTTHAVSATGAGLLLLANPRSGTAVVRTDPLPEIRRRLPDATLHELDGDSIDDVVAAALAGDDPPVALGILGGDGSVSHAAHLARRHDLDLLVLPGGTFNHFARAVGLDDVDAALDAYQAGTIRSIVVAEVAVGDGEPVTVLNAVSLGAYPQMLAEREKRTSFGKWWGGVVATWRALHGAQAIGVGRRGHRATVWSVFVSVGRNDPRRVATMQRLTLDDATLDARIHHARGSRLRAIAALAFGRRTAAVLRVLRLLPPASDIERIVEPELDLRVDPRGAPAVWVHDGEIEQAPAGGFRLTVRAVADGLRVYAPAG